MPTINDFEELRKKEEEFQQHLKAGHCTYIGPHPGDPNFKEFFDRANTLAPARNALIARVPQDALGNRKATDKALGVLPVDAEIDVYAGDGKMGFIFGTIEEYCDKHNIQTK